MKLIFWGGILLFIGGMILAINSSDNIQVEMRGTLVKMRIEKLPKSCLGARINHYATFSYDGTLYIKQIPPGFCDKHYIGEFVEMKFLDKHSVILFPNESAKRELISAIFLAIVGLGMSITQWKKIRNEK
jgi:hypothetical protein